MPVHDRTAEVIQAVEAVGKLVTQQNSEMVGIKTSINDLRNEVAGLSRVVHGDGRRDGVSDILADHELRVKLLEEDKVSRDNNKDTRWTLWITIIGALLGLVSAIISGVVIAIVTRAK